MPRSTMTKTTAHLLIANRNEKSERLPNVEKSGTLYRVGRWIDSTEQKDFEHGCSYFAIVAACVRNERNARRNGGKSRLTP